MQIRVSIGEANSLIQARSNQSKSGCFRAPANIMSGKLQGPARSDKTLLAYGKLVAQAYRWQSRNDHRYHRNVAIARYDFDSAANVHRVARRLMHPDYNLLRIL